MNLLKVSIGCIALLILLKGCRSDPRESQIARPNILLILADDMGYGDVSIAGNTYLKTPHLDNMSRKSVSFKYFYVSPVCAPTRASLLTGKYHQKVKVRSVTNGFETMDPEAVTLAEILKDEGYRTAIFGKWHLGEYFPSVPNAQGFDEYLGFRTGHTSDYFDPILEHNGRPEATNGYITDLLSSKAMEFMNLASEDPFFCYLAYNAPHSPLQIDSSKFQHFLKKGLNDKTARVYGMVENIDENVGKILADLENSGELENTIVVFLSDNGPISGWQVPQDKMRYNAGLRDQKFTTYEGGIRTQCYWMWQGKWQPFYDSTSVAAHIDVVPTLANIINIALPDSLGIDGTDLSNLLEEHIPVDDKRMFFEDFNLSALRTPKLFEGGMARQSSYKMSNGTELFDLEKDPGEQFNLAEIYPEILDNLNDAYENYYNHVFSNGHISPLPIKVGYFEENPVRIKSHHGLAKGGVQFMGFRGHYNEIFGTHPTGVDGDWTSNWKKKGDEMQWEVEFIEETEYEIGISLNGRVDADSCVFTIEINDQVSEVVMPEIKKEEGWKYISLTNNALKGTASISVRLQKIGSTDSLNINELIVTRLK